VWLIWEIFVTADVLQIEIARDLGLTRDSAYDAETDDSALGGPCATVLVDY
jgi:hypothetical protein